MKKLLLMALLCVGAKSFAATQGNATTASMPISVTGEVLAGSTKNLIIESETAGLNGGVMAFKFGALEKPKAGTVVKELSGDFTVRLDDGSEIASQGEATDGSPAANKLIVGLDETTFAKIKGISNLGGNTNIALNYTLNGKLNPEKTCYNGQILVQATIATNSVTGAFSDNQRIYAKVGE